MASGSLKLYLSANSERLTKELAKAQKSTSTFAKKASKSLDMLKKGFTILTAVATAGLLGLAKSALSSGDALAKNADKLAINTKELAALKQATELYTNVGLASMTEALTKAEKRLGEFAANGAGAAAKWIKRLNINVQEFQDLSPLELFSRYADEIRNLNTRSEQLAATSALFGDEARNLLPLIDQGSEAIRAAAEQTERFGTAMTRLELAQFEAANDAAHNLGQAFAGVGNSIALLVSPAIKWVSEQLTRLVVWFNDQLRSLNETLKASGWFDPIELKLFVSGKPEIEEAMNSQLESVVSYLASEEEALFNSYERRSNIIWDNVKDQERANDLVKQLTVRYNNDLLNITSNRLDKETMLRQQAASNAASIGTNLASIFKDQSATAFKTFQGFAIVESTINSYQAFTKALAQGGVYGYVAAGAVLAAGLAKVHAIASMSPGGGGAGAVGGGGAPAIPGAPSEPQGQEQIQTQPTQTNIIRIQIGDTTLEDIVVEGIKRAQDNDSIIFENEGTFERVIAV